MHAQTSGSLQEDLQTQPPPGAPEVELQFSDERKLRQRSLLQIAATQDPVEIDLAFGFSAVRSAVGPAWLELVYYS